MPRRSCRATGRYVDVPMWDTRKMADAPKLIAKPPHRAGEWQENAVPVVIDSRPTKEST